MVYDYLPPSQYRNTSAQAIHRVNSIGCDEFLDELGEAAEQNIGVGIVQLESKRKLQKLPKI